MAKKKEAPRLLSVRETAEMLGIRENTVRMYLWRGQFTSIRKPGQLPSVFLREDEVLAYRDQRGKRPFGRKPADEEPEEAA